MIDRHMVVTQDKAEGKGVGHFTAIIKEHSLVIDVKSFKCRRDQTDRLALQLEDWAKSYGVDIDYDRTD